jgi:hypothetical protein
MSMFRKLVPKTEWKFFDTIPSSLTTIPNGNGTQPIPLINMAQGITDQTRVGDEITPKNNYLRFTLTRGLTDSFVRVIMFWWKAVQIAAAPGTATPQTPDVLQTAPVPGFQYLAPINKDQGRNVKVIYDRTFTLGTGESQIQVEKVYRQFKYVTTEFQQSAIYANKNQLYILFIGSEVLANQPTVSYYNRLTYTDA